MLRGGVEEAGAQVAERLRQDRSDIGVGHQRERSAIGAVRRESQASAAPAFHGVA